MDTNANPLQAPAAGAPISSKNTEALFADLVAQVGLVKKAIAAEKSGGLPALAPLVPEAAAAIKTDIAAVQAAIPEIKAGAKSSEFWAAVGASVLGFGYFAVTGKDVPVNLSAVTGGLVAVYIAARTMLKAKAVAA